MCGARRLSRLLRQPRLDPQEGSRELGRAPPPFIHVASALLARVSAPQPFVYGRRFARHWCGRSALWARYAFEIDAPSVLDDRPMDDEAKQNNHCHKEDSAQDLHVQLLQIRPAYPLD